MTDDRKIAVAVIGGSALWYSVWFAYVYVVLTFIARLQHAQGSS